MKNLFKSLLKFYRDLPIRNKLLLILYIQIFIPLVLIGYMSYKNSEGIIRERSFDYSQDILRMIELRLSDYVRNLNIISQDLLYDKKIYSALADGRTTRDTLQSYELESEINNILKKIVLSRDEVQSICLISNDRRHFFADDNSKDFGIMDVLPYEKVLESARKGNGKVIWHLDIDEGRAKNVFLARTVNNRDNFKEIGLLVILVRKEFIETVYRGLTESMQNIAVISSQGELIAARNISDGYLARFNPAESFNNGRESKIDKNAGVLVSYVSLENPDWKLVTYISLKELYKDAAVLRKRIVLFCIISVFILYTLNLFIALDFIKPIKRLVDGMKKVQSGESDVFVEDNREDELGFMNKTFNEMSKEINHLVTWVYREQITRKEAEVKALQSQINPHFLFNTLESINWIAQLNNVPEISETVSDLSALMEASIGRDDRLITLEEEITYIDKYIAIIKKRFEERMQLLKEIGQDALKVKIPRLLIQPLVENAVYHGIEKIRDTGIIILSAAIKDNTLLIEVSDNGPGISPDNLEKLNDRLSMDNDVYFKTLGGKNGKSIGIENVNRRIKLFYGEAYGLRIESEPGQFTRVSVTVPVEPGRNIDEIAALRSQ